MFYVVSSVSTAVATMIAMFTAIVSRLAAAPAAAGGYASQHYAGMDPSNISRLVGDASTAVMSAAPGDMASVWNTWQLSITLNTDSMFQGAQLIIDALGGPYLYIAGLALGASILGAIIAAVSRIRI